MSASPLSFMRKALFAALILALLVSSPAQAAPAPTPPQPQTISFTLPWLAGMARFIVGTTLKVQPLAAWTQEGTLKSLRRPPKNQTVIALDPKDAARYSMKPGNKDLYLLYDNLPVPEERRITLPYDPSVLPFLSQRMLIVLCELEPENYSFYQRRLAEFQSRLESTLEVGRSLLRGVPLLDLTGSVSPWVRAATDRAVRPPSELWEAWSKSTRTPELAMAVEEANKRGWPIILDAWTPAPIRARVMGVHKNVFIKAPEGDYDFFTYLHDVFLEIWSSSVRK